MSSSILRSTFRYLSDLVVPPQTSTSNSAEQGSRAGAGKTDGTSGGQSSRPSPVPFAGKKRKAEERDFQEPPMKRPVNDDRDMIRHGAATPSAINVSTRTTEDQNRILMPPPPTPHKFTNYRPGRSVDAFPKPRRDDDAVSFVSSAITRRKIETMQDHAMEEARRHAAAIRLPPNSGIWSQTERELFFHLAYRGFEALLPENWMLDFDTLPLSLFANGYTADIPIIHNVRDNQFRACHALRQLFEAGHDVRDRTHVSPGYKREKILERAVKRYLDWALTDVGLRPSQKSKYIPVHIIVTKRGGRSTLQTLEEIATKLHSLSQQHRRAQGIELSVEHHEQDTTDVDETRVVTDDESTPTLIGLVIISTVLVIVTLSPFSIPPPHQSIRQTVSPPNSDPDRNSCIHAEEFNADRLRIIAELDFSQKDQDVWNALGVAIVAMQIRKEAAKANSGLAYDDIDAAHDESMSTDESKPDELGETLGSLPRLEVDDPDI